MIKMYSKILIPAVITALAKGACWTYTTIQFFIALYQNHVCLLVKNGRFQLDSSFVHVANTLQ